MNRAGISLDSWDIILDYLMYPEKLIMKIIIGDFREIFMGESDFYFSEGHYQSKLVSWLVGCRGDGLQRFQELELVFALITQNPHIVMYGEWALFILMIQQFNLCLPFSSITRPYIQLYCDSQLFSNFLGQILHTLIQFKSNIKILRVRLTHVELYMFSMPKVVLKENQYMQLLKKTGVDTHPLEYKIYISPFDICLYNGKVIGDIACISEYKFDIKLTQMTKFNQIKHSLYKNGIFGEFVLVLRNKLLLNNIFKGFIVPCVFSYKYFP
jgi:hypothetical protein